MSRAENRRLKKYGNINGIQPTKTVDDFVAIYGLAFILGMDSEDIPKETIFKVVEKAWETADCMRTGHVNISDVREMCRDICGIDFVANKFKNVPHVAEDGTIIGGY